MCIFAPYSKILPGVNLVHVNGALLDMEEPVISKQHFQPNKPLNQINRPKHILTLFRSLSVN